LLNLDDLDLKIIRELGGSNPPKWNVRESYSAISRKLGVDEETVRTRVNRARERGFLPRWHVMVNPLLIGCREAILNLEVMDESRTPESISKITGVDGVYAVTDFRGKELGVMLYYEGKDSLSSRVSEIESICGSQSMALWDCPFPRPDLQMKALDWKVIDAMREDAWADLDLVAKSIGTSTRTVQRRLSAMIEGRAVYLSRPPNVDAVGGLMCNYLISFTDPEKKRAADYAIHSNFSRIGASDTSSDNYSMFGISCQNFSEADEVARRLEAIDGVQSARMRIMRQAVVVQDWLRARIETRIRA
jgi:DNA-binding Lrp family transcriptional regulator